MAIASSRPPRPCARYSSSAAASRSRSISTPSPGVSAPRLAVADRRGLAVRPCPSSDPVGVDRGDLAGRRGAEWVNIASETSKWLLECDPQVSPNAWQSWATRPSRPWSRSPVGERDVDAPGRTACAHPPQSVAIILVASAGPSPAVTRPSPPGRRSGPPRRRVLGVGDTTSRLRRRVGSPQRAASRRSGRGSSARRETLVERDDLVDLLVAGARRP